MQRETDAAELRHRWRIDIDGLTSIRIADNQNDGSRARHKLTKIARSLDERLLLAAGNEKVHGHRRVKMGEAHTTIFAYEAGRQRGVQGRAVTPIDEAVNVLPAWE